MSEVALLWCDMETGGLNGRQPNGRLGVEEYPIFELAAILTDVELNQIGEALRLVIHHPEDVIARSDEWAITAHTNSGLLEEVRQSTLSLADAEQQVLAYLKANGVNAYDRSARSGAIMVGNSIPFDRSFIMSQMPALNNYLHYRQLDISALALASRYWNPAIEKAAPTKTYTHRALTDIEESIAEARHYRSIIAEYVSPTSLDERALIADPSTSYWLRAQLNVYDGRDPLDALADAEMLVAVLKARATKILGSH